MSFFLRSGIGAQIRGFRNSGLYDVDVIATSEIDKDAIVSYAAIHCGLTPELIETYDYPSADEMVKYLESRNIGYVFEKNKAYDWRKKRNSADLKKYYLACVLSKNMGDITKIKELPYVDFLTYSFPCFVGDTLVLTDKGYTEIKDVEVGDLVLTHTNQYHKVTDFKCTGKKEIYQINAMCFDTLKTTSNHRFYVRTRHRVNTRIKGKAVNYRYFDLPTWKECDWLTTDDYLGYAINTNSIIPKWDGIDFVWADGRSTRHKNELQNLMANKDFWWLIGRYVADGWCRNQSGIIICCGKNKKGQIEPHLEACNLNYCLTEDRTVYRYHVSLKEMEKFVRQFGYKACGKFIPSFVLDMPCDLCKAFLDGYWSGDGCYTQGQYKATSVSKNLIYGIAQLIAKVYKRPFSINKTKRKPQTVIEGRMVNQKDSYSISFKKTKDIQDKAFYEDGYIWFPIKEVVNTGIEEDVYDITVETDHSFTANGCIVHNCTDISVAGQIQGIERGKTRSGLLYEVERLLSAKRESLPKFLLLENVKNLVSKRFKPQFDDWCNYLSDLGYNTYWQVVNGKDCGIPQNRERCFALSIRKDIDTGKFTFPQPFDTGIRLFHVLDFNADEKYILTSDAADKALNEMADNGTLAEEEQMWDELNRTRNDFPDYGIICNEPIASNDEIAVGGAVPMNDQNGCCRTLKQQYAKTAIQNLQSQGTFGATGVVQWK